MVKRGRIVRDPSTGPGLVMVQGRQHVFPLEGIWQSDALPRPGVIVDVDFDEAGRIHAMTVVPEARLAREQVEAALRLAHARATTLAGLIASVGRIHLAALAVAALCWFWPAAFELHTVAFGPRSLSLWQTLGVLNNGNPLAGAPGPYGLCVLVCLCGPLFGSLCRKPRAHLASLMPLLCVLAVLGCLGVVRITGVVRISLDAGAYLALLAGAQLGLAGTRRFLVARAGAEVGY
jgi:hypothetical protein